MKRKRSGKQLKANRISLVDDDVSEDEEIVAEKQSFKRTRFSESLIPPKAAMPDLVIVPEPRLVNAVKIALLPKDNR